MGRAEPGVRRAVALGLACAVAAAPGCAAKGETTPLGYVVAPSVAIDAGASPAIDAGYSTTTAASDARR